MISIHALREEGDQVVCCLSLSSIISIHALREEGDTFIHHEKRAASISIHALREEGDAAVKGTVLDLIISIHALREEGDRLRSSNALYFANFYPRPPRGGRRPPKPRNGPGRPFLSTPSARRATRLVHALQHQIHISIHALREEGDGFCTGHYPPDRYFYPRPPRGGRRVLNVQVCVPVIFLSTPSARRAT